MQSQLSCCDLRYTPPSFSKKYNTESKRLEKILVKKEGKPKERAVVKVDCFSKLSGTCLCKAGECRCVEGNCCSNKKDAKKQSVSS